ncbi:MAG TPA: hypothetical protein VE685_14475 [Thermoanaerobaculia bacterium]|nr:hypothetical protein [Thermoanaerobaculia bacterium]
MHIHEFHLKFVSSTEEGGLLAALRRLSRLEDPQAMMSDDDTIANDWIVWTEAEPGLALSPVPAPA